MGDKLLLCCEEGEKYKLLEVTEEILCDLEIGGSVCIKGQPAEDAVLYIANTTNRVVSSLSAYYEMTKVVPRLNTLHHILAKCHYSGGEEGSEQQGDKKFLTFHDISTLVQASDNELIQGLNSINAFELNGFWRVLAPSLIAEIVDSLLTNATIHGWSLSALDEQSVLSSMPEYDHKILLHLLTMYGTRTNTKWQLDLKKLSIFRAKELLLCGESGRDWRLSDFTTAWQDSVPDGAPTNMELLQGLAVVVQQGKESMMRYLSATELCSVSDPKERFQHIFKVQPQWSMTDLSPYLVDLAPNLSGIQSMVLKHARAIVAPNGTTFYCARESL